MKCNGSIFAHFDVFSRRCDSVNGLVYYSFLWLRHFYTMKCIATNKHKIIIIHKCARHGFTCVLFTFSKDQITSSVSIAGYFISAVFDMQLHQTLDVYSIEHYHLLVGVFLSRSLSVSFCAFKWIWHTHGSPEPPMLL